MFDTICTLPLSADLFAQVIHPGEPLVAVGLSSGHVATLKLPFLEGDGSLESSAPGSRRASHGKDVVETAWRTKRHKGSCRCLAYSVDGRQLYSAGTDGVVKAADSETGKVIGKVAVPLDASSRAGSVDAPTVLHALSPQTLLLATDSGALHLYDLRDPAPSLPVDQAKTAFTGANPAQTHHPHTDYISSLSAIPASDSSTSGYSKQWLTTGGTTLALTDLRRGVLVKSEDQEEILMSSLYITGLPVNKSNGSTGEKAIVGGGDGVITLWQKGQWDDQDERIIVSKEKETLDVMAELPDGVGGLGKRIAVGLGDGTVRFVRLGSKQVVGGVRHHDVEGVVGLGFDVGGRMISGGGQVIKVWREHDAGATEAEEETEAEERIAAGAKRSADNKGGGENDEAEEGQNESDEEEEKPRKRRKKRKRGKGPATTGGGLSLTGLD
ncbi:WD repeat-containing protein jip5 [Friedmanniomyces endolithicus]|uniref:WD repeat-containing protein JIP5 n=1 Tax=Friedmanniomyces endolithicus TaxID=329885 RepID=A0AAN6KXN9_9PEZI|nr:WD repeat-containing protein jip5 [Friedmanniomyces endolithicus]KAK0297371.1 WD repeat-containing protein jip5 [Friedmanniomyces endolithicus]KAK0315489.1 WD repeat-containing protein jip5 [Friedmanniomyces endolithicus]KAK0323018.1 WD repeat-containing protein jip5 [Friedmanniomyces endolithicus]KAK0827017.1 WD repeat-containing protein jip5 [Friedmanniomyces endolithicus]